MGRRDYVEGKKFRVVKAGASIHGMKPVAPGVQQGFEMKLGVGDVITCAGESMARGDGVPAIKWRDATDAWICNDALFSPVQGGMWEGQVPEDGYLEEAK